MKKKLLTVALAAAMTVMSTVGAFAETLTGTAWWTGMQAGTDYSLSGDGSVTLTVEVKSAAENGNAAFSVEIYDVAGTGTGHFFTTGSDGNGWFAENANLTGVEMTKNPFADAGNTAAGKVEAGKTYEVTVTRAGDNFSMVYYNVTDGSQLYEIAGKTGEAFPNDLKVHVMAQEGTFEVNQKVEAPTEAPTTAPAEGGNGNDATTAGGNGNGATTAATNGGATTPNTGDATMVGLLVAVAAVSAVVVLKKRTVAE